MFFIYRFKNIQDEIIYVGATDNLDKRIKEHFSFKMHFKKQAYGEIYKFEYAIAGDSKDEMFTKKLYYINKWKPKFNNNINKKYKEQLELLNFEDNWMERKFNELTEMAKLNSIAKNVIFHAEKYIKLVNKKKELDPVWYEKNKNTDYYFYKENFYGWYVKSENNSWSDYVFLQDGVRKYGNNQHSLKHFEIIYDYYIQANDILLNGYAQFIEIENWESENPSMLKIHLYNYNKKSVNNKENTVPKRKSRLKLNDTVEVTKDLFEPPIFAGSVGVLKKKLEHGLCAVDFFDEDEDIDSCYLNDCCGLVPSGKGAFIDIAYLKKRSNTKLDSGKIIEFNHTKWNGEISRRRAIYLGTELNNNKLNKEKQLLLHVFDVIEGKDERFAIQDISEIDILN